MDFSIYIINGLVLSIFIFSWYEEFSKVTDVNKIVDLGETGTPALVVDGVVKFYGKIPTVEEIKQILK